MDGESRNSIKGFLKKGESNEPDWQREMLGLRGKVRKKYPSHKKLPRRGGWICEGLERGGVWFQGGSGRFIDVIVLEKNRPCREKGICPLTRNCRGDSPSREERWCWKKVRMTSCSQLSRRWRRPTWASSIPTSIRFCGGNRRLTLSLSTWSNSKTGVTCTRNGWGKINWSRRTAPGRTNWTGSTRVSRGNWSSWTSNRTTFKECISTLLLLR